MAAVSGSENDPLPERSCVSCNRSVKGNTKCVKCDKRYHPACAVRVNGIKVVGSDMIMCPTCRENASEISDDEYDEAIRENNRTLTMLVLQMQVSQELLLDKIWTLEERIRQYEVVNSIEKNPQKTYAASTKNTEMGQTNQKLMSLKESEISYMKTNANKSSSSSSHSDKLNEVRNRFVNNSTKVNSDYSATSNHTKTLTTEGKVRSTIDNKAVNSAILQAEVAAKMTEIINLGNEETSQTQSMNNTNSNSVFNREWHNVRHKRRRKFVVGQSENDQVQAVPRFTSLHVTRLHPNTTTDDLQKFLESKFSSVVCEKHPSRYPNSYASMKITILREELKNAWRRENWPKGAIVSHFMERRMPSLRDPQVMNGII